MYSLLIKNGKIVDGTGNPWFHADIAIEGETIAGIGQIESASAPKTIDAKNLVVCPGFIDQHSHADLIFASDHPHKYLEGRIRQGMSLFFKLRHRASDSADTRWHTLKAAGQNAASLSY